MDRLASPNIAAARDPDRIAALVQRHLAPADGSVAVRGCAVEHVHLAPGRCLLQYDIGLRQDASGREWTTVVSGLLYSPERAAATWAELAPSVPAAGPWAPLAAAALAPELGLILQAFPFDGRLPALADLLSGPPPWLAPELARRLAVDATALAPWRATVVRYRADVRGSVRLDLGHEPERRLYAKVYREPEAARGAFATQSALAELTGDGAAGFAVAAPVALVEERRTVVLAEARGERLLDLLRAGSRGEAVAAARRTAEAVAALHTLPATGPLGSPSGRSDLARLDAVAAALHRATPALAGEVDRIVAAVAALPAGTPAPTHGDLKPGHVLLDGDRVALLDFDKLSAGDSLTDAANLLVSLGRGRGGNARRGGPEALTRAFVETYFAAVPADWRDRFPPRLALALLTDAAQSGRGLRGRGAWADRDERIAAQVRRAAAALAGDLWAA